MEEVGLAGNGGGAREERKTGEGEASRNFQILSLKLGGGSFYRYCH